MAHREIDIEQLQVGMFVTKLDVSWLDSPFLTHHIRIRSTRDIDKLRAAKVKRVVIDPSKSSAVTIKNPASLYSEQTVELLISIDTPDPATAPQAGGSAGSKASSVAAAPAPGPTTTLAGELRDAQQVASHAKQVLQQVMDDALSGKAVDKSQVSPIIAEAFASLTRNDQALLTLLHLERHSGTRQVTHAFSVLSLALALGHQLQLARAELEILGLAALLHDVGWVRIPASLFGKGRRYTEAEQKLVDQHTHFGTTILSKSPELPAEVITLVGSHTEHSSPEAQSVPERLHTANAILTAVDSYDTLLHGLMDQPPMQPTAALRTLFIQARSGHFDPEVIAQLVHVLGIYPLTSIVELNTGEIAIVVEMKRPHSLQPVVKICYAADRQPLQPPQLVDLSAMDAEPQRRIQRVLNAEADLFDPCKLLRVDLPPA